MLPSALLLLLQSLMALFTGPRSNPDHVTSCDRQKPRNGFTRPPSPPPHPVAMESRVKMVDQLLVARMRKLQGVQREARGRLVALQEAIQQWQAGCVLDHASVQPTPCCHGNDESCEAAACLRSRLEQAVANSNQSDTDSSSGDELWDGSHGNIRTRRRVLKSSWERDHTHAQSRWAWLLTRSDMVRSHLAHLDHVIPSNVDNSMPMDDHVSSNGAHLISDCCARTEPIQWNRKRPCRLLRQHQFTNSPHKWPSDLSTSMWLDHSLCCIHGNCSYVTQYSSVAKRQRSLSHTNRRNYHGIDDEWKHGSDSPDSLVGYHGSDGYHGSEGGHHGNHQEAGSPFSYYSRHASLSHQQLLRKKRSAEYDINSFVIPYSIASAARPEKLEYKDIPTPGWRQCPTTSSTQQLNGFTDHPEDTSDEVFVVRHTKCEALERLRFQHMCAVASNKRGRGSRHASLADLANQSDPGSPVPLPPVRRPTSEVLDEDPAPSVLPWIHRKFPLCEDEEATLVPPSPADVFSPTPLSPSNNQWTVVPSSDPATSLSAVLPSNHEDQKSSLVLRLAKRT